MISSSGWQGLIISASMSCAVDGFTQQGELRDSFALKNCLFGAGSALVIGTVLQSAPKFKDKLKTFAKPVLVRGLLRMLTEMPSFPPGRAWDFYRLIHPDRIQTEDVTTLFDITPEYASNIADNLHSSSALQNLFRDGDWWAEVRKFTDNPDLRGKLLDDLTENLNLAQAFKERPELVRAWEVVNRAELPAEIRRSPVDLSTIDNYLNTTGKDPIEFSAELAGNAKIPNVPPRSWFDIVPNGGGAAIGQQGDYVIREGGEVFYRAIYPHNYIDLIATGRLPGTRETSTSPKISFSQGYRGVLMKFYLRHGTIDQLKVIGRTDGHQDVADQFGEMPLAPSGWIEEYVRFKREGGNSSPQVNIQLGKGQGMDIFNDNLMTFERID